MPRTVPVLVIAILCTLTCAGPAGAAPPAAPAPAPPPAHTADRAYWSLAAGVYLSGAGDWHTTRAFRAQGVEEGNPLIGGAADSPAGLAAIKLGSGTLVNYACFRLKKEGKRYWAAPQIIWIALNVAVSLYNADAAD